MRIDRASEQTTKDDCSFGTKTGPVGLPLNCTAYGQLHHLLEEPVVPVLSTYLNLKGKKEKKTHWCENLSSIPFRIYGARKEDGSDYSCRTDSTLYAKFNVV
jgi:hypothetical protein